MNSLGRTIASGERIGDPMLAVPLGLTWTGTGVRKHMSACLSDFTIPN